jgi:hypothetical protein
MAEIIAAIDETAAHQLFQTLAAGLPPMSTGGASNLGPLRVTYSASATISPGSIDLIPPDTIRVTGLRVSYSLNASFQLRLGDFLPSEIPRICVKIPCVGKVCTPRIPLHWPTITIPFGFSDWVRADVDLGVVTTHAAGQWRVEGVVLGIAALQWGPGTAAAVAGIGAAVAAAVAWVPFIGPFLSILVLAVTSTISLAGLLGWLGPIVTPFISGLRFPIYDHPDRLEILPAAGPRDPAVFITLDAIAAEVQHNAPEDELVVLADISA